MRTVREEKERGKRGRKMTHHQDKLGNATKGGRSVATKGWLVGVGSTVLIECQVSPLETKVSKGLFSNFLEQYIIILTVI